MKFLVFAVVAVFAFGGQSPQAPSGARIPDPSHQHPAPGTSIVRFAQVDDGAYKGIEVKK